MMSLLPVAFQPRSITARILSGSTGEVVQSPDAGRLMADRSVDALVNALGDLFGAYPSRQAVRAYAEQFDWAETTRRQLALFKQIMDGRAAADPTLKT